MRGVCRALAVALLVAVLFIESGGAKKGKKGKMRKTSAKQAAAASGWAKSDDGAAAPPAPPLPTAEGWANGDTTTPVQEIFKTVNLHTTSRPSHPNECTHLFAATALLECKNTAPDSG